MAIYPNPSLIQSTGVKRKMLFIVSFKHQNGGTLSFGFDCFENKADALRAANRKLESIVLIVAEWQLLDVVGPDR